MISFPLEIHLITGNARIVLFAYFICALLGTPRAQCAEGATSSTKPDQNFAGLFEVTATPDYIYVRGKTSPHHSTTVVLERELWEGSITPIRSNSLFRASPPDRFEFSIPRFEEGRDRLYSAFQAFTVGESGALQPLGERRYPNRRYRISADRSPFPTASNKKGLQVQMVDDALALGIQHAALNLDLGALLDSDNDTNNPSHTFDGQRFHFRSSYLQSLDHQIEPLSRSKVLVSLILLAYKTGNPRSDGLLLHPKYHVDAPNRLTAFNVVTPEGARCYAAAVEFLASRYSSTNLQHGRVVQFIIGNEVNSHWFWYNRGQCSMPELADDYLRAVRIAHTAVRKFSSTARVYLSLEHHWNIRYPGGKETQAFPGRPFLDYFHERAAAEGDFDWHVAFHPYPENLFECRTWLDTSATLDVRTPRVTFKNLEVITHYLESNAMRYAPEPEESYGLRVRRVILSEQGFHASEKPEGELWQAAAYAYAYQRAVQNPGIDSFILHRHVDHAHEGGLNLGLWTRQTNSVSQPARQRRMYQVFKDASTPAETNSFQFALPVIGISQWNQLAPKPLPASSQP